MNPKATFVPRLLLIIGLAALLVCEGFFSWQLHQLSSEQEQIKTDYTDVNNITLGLLSVDNWKDQVAGIVNHQVRHFKLTPKEKHELQVEVEQVIYALIDKAEAMVNKPQQSLGGKIRKLAVKSFVKTDKIRAQVPAFAKSIIAKVDNPREKARLSTMAMSQFNQAQHSTSADSSRSVNERLIQKMYHRYHASSLDQLAKKQTTLLDEIRSTMYAFVFGMLGCILIVLACWWFLRKRVDLHAPLFIMSLLFAFMLLAVGLTASMIEVDCRIQSLDFVLLGEHVKFQNQVLFYESKSILGVVKVLFAQPAADSLAVGALILCFSILFPVTKLISTGIHLLSSRKIAENRIIKFFAFQSGKWSMADVIVIAVLMTYIGLNGLLDSQLAELNIRSNTMTLITTNNTALQPGYIIFISFVLYGLILSTILKAITPYDAHEIPNILLILGLGVLLAASAYFGWRIHILAKQRQEIKQDYSFFNSISFGLFSVDTWREKVSGVIEDQVNGYHITPEQKEQIRQAVEKELHGLIAKTIKEIDKPQKGFGAKLKKLAFHALVDSDALQKQVPPFAQTIVQKVSSPASQARLKNIASSKIGQLENQTYDATSEASDKVSKSIFAKYQVNNSAAFEKTTNERLALISHETVRDVIYLLTCVLAAMLLWLIMRKKEQLQTTLFIMSLLFALVLLAVGLTTTVIEVDARVQSLNLAILGTKITFVNQVLFFQSKSIWGIITTLLSQPKPDAVTVGILILLFILILPFIRLAAKGTHVFVNNNKVINYLAFEAGKWDMADVLIVGLLMTYIGLNGILKSQLTNLNIHNDTLTTATVNYTSLQPGYYIFVAYVIFEIILSRALIKIAGYQAKPRKKYKKRLKTSINA